MRSLVSISLTAAFVALPGPVRAEEAIFGGNFESGELCPWSGATTPCTAAGTITSGGGPAELPGAASLLFPAGAFTIPTEVTIMKVLDPSSSTDFGEFASMFRPSDGPAFFLFVDVGAVPPASETISATFDLPQWMLDSVPAGYRLELFARILQDGGEETVDSFELLPSQLDLVERKLTGQVPGAAFSQGRPDGDSHYRAVLAVVATPGGAESPPGGPRLGSPDPEDGECPAGPIGCPVAGGCTVISPFSSARTHPVLGGVRPHYGIDLQAQTGTEVSSASDGVIERSYTSSSFGETVIVRHSDGSASLVAHLSQRSVAAGQAVSKGQKLGLSGSTGLSEGPHVHFEYVPNGQIIQSKYRIDPAACLEPPCTGPNCECCIANQGCSGETGCECGATCCCCGYGEACSADWSQGCVPVGACLQIMLPTGEPKCIGSTPDPLDSRP